MRWYSRSAIARRAAAQAGGESPRALSHGIGCGYRHVREIIRSGNTEWRGGQHYQMLCSM